MERYILKFKLFLLLLLIYGCNSVPEELMFKDSKVAPVNSVSTNEINEIIETVPEPLNVWDYLKQESNYDAVDIDEQTLKYMNRHLQNLDLFEDYLNKSEYFIFHIIKELEKENLPIELALIPFVESDYDPFSISSSGAVGIWQFMPTTGSLFDLNKSWWNEDRHDAFKSTDAAVGYFSYLLKRFDGDIYLALAAYNGGPTYLDRQIRRNKRRGLGSDFWSLNLSNQSTDYVYKYIALRELIINSDKYEIKLPNIPFKPRVVKIEIPGQVEILTISEHLGLKPELIYKLNPPSRFSTDAHCTCRHNDSEITRNDARF